MSRNTKFIWCILAALLFCAVTYGGCGGSDNLASVADTSGGGTSQPVSGDTSGRGDIGDDWVVIPDPDKGQKGDEWEVIDDLGYLENLVNTWKITNITMETGGKLYGKESMISSGMIGSTFKMNVSNPKEVWGSGSVMEENEGTVNGSQCTNFFRCEPSLTGRLFLWTIAGSIVEYLHLKFHIKFFH